ncbi:MAG: response regulator [Methanomicrobiales archaeon]|nr:response regulator [Methanomicrobiales archaeon]
MKPTRLLVVEDEFITGADLQSGLIEMGYDVPEVVDSGEDAIERAGTLRPDAILMDITLRGKLTGIEAAEVIRKNYGIPIIFLTAHSDDPTFQKAIRSEPFGFIIKPYEPHNLRTSIEMALFKHSMEAKLRESERTVLALLNATPDALILINREKKIVAVNDTMCRRLGRSREDLEGSSVTDKIRPGMLYPEEAIIDTIFSDGHSFCLEDEQEGAWFETTVIPVREPDGTIARIAIQSHDITWRKRFEEQLKSVGIEQIEHNMEQFQILNDQIRTPLQAIMLYLSLTEYEYRPKIEEQVRIIDNLVEQLDKGWLESEKVHSFLIRHYKQAPGKTPEKEDPAGRDR